jgi:hypothetical protein
MTSNQRSFLHTPSAILSDGIIPVPLWSVGQLQIEETYSLPRIGWTSRKAATPVLSSRRLPIVHDAPMGLRLPRASPLATMG